jgi:hypothetical protein
MTSKILSIGLSVALTLSMGLLGKVGCNNMELKERTSQLNTELMQSNLALGRAETQFGNAQDYANDLEKGIQEEIDAREAEITRYGELVARFELLRKRKVRTRVVYKTKKEIKLHDINVNKGALYYAAASNLLREIRQLTGFLEDDIIRIDGKVIATLGADGYFPFEFDYKLKLRFGLKFVETRLPTGGINHYAEVYTLDAKGKRIEKLEIERFQMVVEDPSSGQWFWWAPHLDVGAIGAVKLTPPGFLPGGSLGVSFMGYGLTKNDLEWRALRVSVDIADRQPAIGLTPGLWNAGSLIPLISNLWIGPHVLYLPPESWAIGLFIGAVL